MKRMFHKKRELTPLERANNRFAWKINIPMMIYLACVLLYPMVWGIYVSFTNKSIGNTPRFIGLKNYQRLLTDKEYLNSIKNTLRFTFYSITLKTVFGTIMALALNQPFKGKNLTRAILMLPWTLPNLVVVYNWTWVFNSSVGVANYLLKTFKIIDTNLVWFGDAKLAMLAVVIANVWRGTPFFGISILARLQTIPIEYHEAAAIDGAGVVQRFFHITLPQIKDVIILSMLMSTIWTLNEFETIWLMTGGGPNGATQIMNVYSYKTAMRSMMIGRGIAVSVLALPVLLGLISLISRWMLPKEKGGDRA